MPTKPPPISPEELWQSQPEEETNMTLATIRSTALKFQNKIRRRNMIEYAAAVVATITLGASILYSPNLPQQIGLALVIAGVFVYVYRQHREAASQGVPVDSSAKECLAFHRQELVRQRDFLRPVLRQIAPMASGLVLFFAGSWMQAGYGSQAAIRLTITALLMAAFLGGQNWLKIRAANKLQDEIDSLGE